MVWSGLGLRAIVTHGMLYVYEILETHDTSIVTRVTGFLSLSSQKGMSVCILSLLSCGCCAGAAQLSGIVLVDVDYLPMIQIVLWLIPALFALQNIFIPGCPR